MKEYLKLNWIYFFLITIVAFCIYYPSLHGNFIWDDEQQIVNHIYIRSPYNIPFFFKGSTFYHNQKQSIGIFYRPLMTTVYSLIYPFSGGKPFAFHLVQLLFHILNTFFLILVLSILVKRTFRSSRQSNILVLLVAIIFLIHPMNSEVVSYSANLQDVLFFFFGIIALYVIIRIQHLFTASVLSSLLLLLSLFSKETGVLFVALLLCYIYLYRKNVIILFSLCYATVLAVYMIIRCGIAHMCHSNNGPNPIAALPFIKYVMQLPAIIFYYLKTFFYPKNVAIGQHWWIQSFSFRDVVLPLLIISLVFLSLVLIWLYLNFRLTTDKKYKNIVALYTFFAFWFLIGILMHLHIMPLDFTVADRWFYFSMPGLLGILICVIFIFYTRYLKQITFAYVIIAIIFASMTWHRNMLFQNPLTLYLHDNEITPNSFDLENNIGVEYYRKKEYEKAQLHFNKSVSISPSWPVSLINLGVTYERQGKYHIAEKYYLKGIKNNHYYPGFVNYARILRNQNKKKEARKFLKETALVYYPDDKTLQDYLKEKY